MQLAQSIRNLQLHVRLVLCVVEMPQPIPESVRNSFDYLCSIDDLKYDSSNSFMFRHTIVEASTAVKARLCLHLLSTFEDEDDFIYLDPDVVVYSPFKELETAFEKGNLVLTPHLLRDEAAPEKIGPVIFQLLNGGIFNLGFIAVRRSIESQRFLRWWMARIESWCYDDRANGLFVDQKWVDFAVPFTNFVVLQEPGYNLAFWNAKCRYITKVEDQYFANAKPIRFIHFSNVDTTPRTQAFLRQLPRESEIHDLVGKYLANLGRLGQTNSATRVWSYGLYASGEMVSKEARIAYRSSASIRDIYPDPFCASNGEILAAYNGLHVSSRLDGRSIT